MHTQAHVPHHIHRTDNKLYRLQTPQTPLARTSKYDEFCMDEYPAGTNAVVAVLAYTGAHALTIASIGVGVLRGAQAGRHAFAHHMRGVYVCSD